MINRLFCVIILLRPAGTSSILEEEFSLDSAFTHPLGTAGSSLCFINKKSLLSNSSEWRLAEQQKVVPDLLPTQESNEKKSQVKTEKLVQQLFLR